MKAVIVGCGTIAPVHATVLKKMEGCELAAFADIKIERAEQFAKEYGGKAYGSMEEMLEAEKPDVMHICTPHYLHVPMAIYGLTHGVNVWMEKPPAISKAQFAELKDVVAASDKRLGICFQNRYNPCVQKAKKLIESGKAGKVRGGRGMVTWSRMEKYYTESDWRGSLATEGGGALINQTIHTMDLLVYLLGKPLAVEAGIANHHLKGIIEVEDTMEAFIRFADCTASFYATTAYCDDRPPFIEIACENVTIRIEDPDVTYFWKDGRVEKPLTETNETLGKSYWGSGHASCINDFYHALESGEESVLDLKHIEDTALLMLNAYESARGGAVELPVKL